MSKKQLIEVMSNIDSKVLTEDVKSQISEAFDAEVAKKVEEGLKAKTDVLTESVDEFTGKIVESIAKDMQNDFEKAVSSKASELVKVETKTIVEKAKEDFNSELENLSGNIDKYATYIAEKFVEENKSSWEDEVAVAKAEAIMESASDFAKDFGIKLDNITSEEQTRKELDEAVTSNKSLKEQNFEYEKAISFMENTKDMSETQKEKLSGLLESVHVENINEFKEKLDTFKVLTKTKETPKTKVVESKNRSASWK